MARRAEFGLNQTQLRRDGCVAYRVKTVGPWSQRVFERSPVAQRSVCVWQMCSISPDRALSAAQCTPSMCQQTVNPLDVLSDDPSCFFFHHPPFPSSLFSPSVSLQPITAVPGFSPTVLSTIVPCSESSPSCSTTSILCNPLYKSLSWWRVLPCELVVYFPLIL